MDSTANTSTDSNHGSTASKQDAKKQQFSRKQRMDMYAFCVLELEVNGNKVSIKKQQNAIKRILKKEMMKKKENGNSNNHLTGPGQGNASLLTSSANPPTSTQQALNETNTTTTQLENHHHNHNEQAQASTQVALTNGHPHQATATQQDESQKEPSGGGQSSTDNGIGSVANGREIVLDEGKTLLQLQQEIAANQRCYSDYQKTQVLTSSMLKEVQKRFAKYYPDAPCPSRTTIKHVFEKCVEHGSVDNVKNPRKVTKKARGDEVEYLLMHEPQLSLRQMAQRLNVSTGTVSRRCQALGLIPESVTVKHQQMATARRQKQMRQLDGASNNKPKQVRRPRAANSQQDQQAAAASSSNASAAPSGQTDYANRH